MRDLISATIILPLTLVFTSLFLYSGVYAYGSVRKTALIEASFLRWSLDNTSIYQLTTIEGHRGLATHAELAHLTSELVLDLKRTVDVHLSKGSNDDATAQN